MSTLAILQNEMQTLRQEIKLAKQERDPKISRLINRLDRLQDKFDELLDKSTQETEDDAWTRAEQRSKEGFIENVGIFLANLGLAYLARHHLSSFHPWLQMILDPGVLAWPLGTGLVALLLARLGRYHTTRTTTITSSIPLEDQVPSTPLMEESVADPMETLDGLEIELDDKLNLNATPRRSRRLKEL